MANGKIAILLSIADTNVTITLQSRYIYANTDFLQVASSQLE